MSAAMSPPKPAVSVIIPTYNRAELLERTLDSLAAQRFPEGMLEVVVADDGSTDATADVAHAAADRLPTRYYHQEDRGFRAGAARNGGARLASAPILAFVDTGVIAGPGFAQAHYDAHCAGRSPAKRGTAVLGYVYGFVPQHPTPGLVEMLATRPVEDVVDRLRHHESFHDIRRAELAEADFNLARLHTPWELCWSVNLSVHADDFWSAGGFDESFVGYGCEDLELGYRLTRHGIQFAISCDAWAVETPHDRDTASNLTSWRRNVRRFLDKQPDPPVELYAAISTYHLPVSVEHEYRTLLHWQSQASGMDVYAELADAVAPGSPPATVAGIGCGQRVPASWPQGCTLVDFDRELLDLAAADRPGASQAHAIGLHTPFGDQSFDLVVISSRLAGLWDRWGDALLSEAHRIGRKVRVPLIHLGC